MPDLLVKLYQLPVLILSPDNLKNNGIELRRALPPEKSVVVEWVRHTFQSNPWANECDVCFANKPVSCFIAIQDKKIVVSLVMTLLVRISSARWGLANRCGAKA